jgi:hypothetical protein
MKIITIFIGICLVGLISACGLFNSDKFNPHQIDGRWHSSHVVTIRNYKNQFIYKNFLKVNYPYIHACSEKQNAAYADSIYWQLKENLKIAHTKGNFYKAKKINGTATKSTNLIYKIKKDTSFGVNLYINPKDFARVVFGTFYKSDPIATGYSKCRANAILVDTLF